MMTLRLIFVVIIANMVISKEDTNGTEVISPEAKNAFKFEEQSDVPQSYGLIRFEGQNNVPGYVESHQRPDNELQRIKFEEENRIENQRPNHQKKKRRRRRPKQLLNGLPGTQNAGVPGYSVRPAPVYPGPFYPGQGPYLQSGYPEQYPGQFHRPRPPPSALSAVTEALTSIALYDDRQCVPRLLCEAAGGAGVGAAGSTGTGSLGDSGAGVAGAGGLLQAITGLQPLLTLLAAYNGISSSPLFVFGRAVFLGMTSKANPGTCRYAYPDCPNDPEQLVHYLNNHNGGFFRFFAAPELNQQQGVEQFYNQLSGQNYGYYQPQQNLQQVGYGQLQQQSQNLLDYGHHSQQQQYQNQHLQQQSLYQNQNLQQVGYGQHLQQNYQSLQNTGGPYGHTYGYPYQQNININRLKSNKIQKRIQNTPNTELFVDNNVNSKWLFPDDSNENDRDAYNNVRLGKVLKFPQSNVESAYAAEGFIFPGSQSNREYTINNIEEDTNEFIFDGPVSVNDFRFENQYNFGKEGSHYRNNDDVRTLYIVRGNGDPNHPEIVHLTPGQRL